MSRLVREATARDAAACLRIYAPYVRDTVVSFESEPPTEAGMAARIAAATATHAWLVLEDDGDLIAYAYGGPFAPRAAYQWACEVSVYVEMGRHRTGAGRTLYEALLPRLSERGFHMAVAGMSLPNEGSVALHRAMGFQPVGTWRRIGFKHGAWHDVAWTQRQLADGPPSGPPR